MLVRSLLLASFVCCLLPAADIFAEPAGGWPAAPTGGGSFDLASRGIAGSRILLSVPESYRPAEAHPLAIVLHGGPGGRPEAMAGVYRRLLDARGVISAYPQALRAQLLDWNYPHTTAYLLHLVREIASRYRLDPRRIYLLGHSMGGGGTWAQGAVLADLWAGLGPSSGWAVPTPAPDFRRLAGMPIWCIHGSADQAVPIALSRLAFERLAATRQPQRILAERPADLAGLDRVRHILRELPGVGHNVFDPRETLGGPELSLQLDWLLAQRRAQPPDLPAAMREMTAWGEQFGWKPDERLGVYADEAAAR